MKYLTRTGAVSGLRLVLATLIATLATTSLASSFHGIEPGVSHREEVMKTFGNPTSLLGANNAKILLYSGWNAPAGTVETQVKIDSATNRVLSIVIFPSRVLTPALVEGMFGRGCGPTR